MGTQAKLMQYAEPDVLVSTEWVAQHLQDPSLRTVEVDEDTSAYYQGHVPGAVRWNWRTELCDTLTRDIIPVNKLEELLGSSGISNDTMIVLYGDNNNWFAAWALWQLKIYGHQDVRLMDGGHKKWLKEGRELSADPPKAAPKTYKAQPPDFSIRASLGEVQKAMQEKRTMLVDVRSEQEFTGEIAAPPGLPETCQRGGHIPGAKNIPWNKVCNDDGTFKSAAELRQLYEGQQVTPDKPVIAYCRIGERSSHTWFVLRHLLGYKDVKNYDGSWTEWGNLVGAPVEKPFVTKQAMKTEALVEKPFFTKQAMKAEEYLERQDAILGWKVRVVSYRLGDRFVCSVYNLDPEGRLTHSEGAVRDEAESSALEKARWFVEHSAYRTR